MCETSNITLWGSTEEYIRQFQQLYTIINGRYIDRNHSKEVYKVCWSLSFSHNGMDCQLLDSVDLLVVLISSQYYRRVYVPRFGHRALNIDGKPVLNVDNLCTILTFNIAFNTSIFPGERYRISLAGCYQLLYYTRARPTKLVDGEPKDVQIC